MTYTTGIPRAGQSLGNSRSYVQGNFDYINTAFAVNHVAFNSSGVGKHKFLQMPEQSPNGPATAVDEGALYTKQASALGTQLYWRPENTLAAGTEILMTNVPPVNAASGYSFLPGGLLIQWAKVSTTGGTNTSVTFPIAFDAATVPYSVQLTFAQAIGVVDVLSVGAGGSFTNTGFNLRKVLTSVVDVFYIAIGKKTT